VSVAVFLTALVTLVLIPRRANRAARVLTPRPEDYPDTALLIRRAVLAQAGVTAADSALGRTRTRALRIAAADTLPPALAARRDSLAAGIAELSRVARSRRRTRCAVTLESKCSRTRSMTSYERERRSGRAAAAASTRSSSPSARG
jgi:hypothetical protein